MLAYHTLRDGAENEFCQSDETSSLLAHTQRYSPQQNRWQTRPSRESTVVTRLMYAVAARRHVVRVGVSRAAVRHRRMHRVGRRMNYARGRR